MEKHAVYLGFDGTYYKFKINDQIYLQTVDTIRIPIKELNEGFQYLAI